MDARRKRRRDFIPRFSNAGIHDFLRWHARAQRPLKLACRRDVSSGAAVSQRADNSLIGVGLVGIVNRRLHPRKRRGKIVVVLPQLLRGITIKRRPHGCHYVRQRHGLGA